MKVVLLAILMLHGAAQPSVTQTEQPDLKTCWQKARAFVDSDQAKNADNSGAGCLVQR